MNRLNRLLHPAPNRVAAVFSIALFVGAVLWLTVPDARANRPVCMCYSSSACPAGSLCGVDCVSVNQNRGICEVP